MALLMPQALICSEGFSLSIEIGDPTISVFRARIRLRTVPRLCDDGTPIPMEIRATYSAVPYVMHVADWPDSG